MAAQEAHELAWKGREARSWDLLHKPFGPVGGQGEKAQAALRMLVRG